MPYGSANTRLFYVCLPPIKKVLANLGNYDPGATKYKIADFFFWQGAKDNETDAYSAQ